MTRPVVRALLAFAAVAAAIALAGCNADNVVPTGRAQAPLSETTVALIESKNMDKNSPILVRVFKQEAELEVWKKNRDGRFALLKTYPICRWSGDLGPKKKQGDRQAPEGFYTITPGQMNPFSNYYLAFNTGYPNAYDRAHGYTGSELMVHGDCSSRGCYAMTDKQILEIYALARDAFFGGQKEFQFEAFPFRMTALNMARHRNDPNFAFWKMLKEGYDHFEATRQEPEVAVCDKRYVFDAVTRNGGEPLHSNPRGKCPAYQLDPQVASAVLDYRRDQQVKMASYIARGVAEAPPHVGDGGSNPIFAGGFTTTPDYDDSVHTYKVASTVPGALPRVPNPPGTTIPKVGAALKKNAEQPEPASKPEQQPQQHLAMTSVPLPSPAPLPKEGEKPQQTITIASLIGNLFQRPQQPQATPGEPAATEGSAAASEAAPVELRGSNTEMAAKPKRTAPARTANVRTASPIKLHPKPRSNAPAKPLAVAHNRPAPAAPKPPAQPVQQAAKTEKPAQRVAKSAPPPEDAPVIRTAFTAPPASSNGLLAGAQPVMPTGAFSR